MSCELIWPPTDLAKSQGEGASRLLDASFSFYIRRIIRVFAAAIVFCLLSSPVYAHKVNMFAYVEGNKVMMEGYFSDGNKPVNCEVVVTDPNKKVLVKGVTDQEGKFSFDIPELTDLRIVLNAGMGHRGEFRISRDELAGADPVPVASANSETMAPPMASSEEPQGVAADSLSASEAAIRKAVVEANLPLMRAIEEMKESAGFANIVGGIGFIFGIVGIFFYLKARKMLGQSGTQPPVSK